MKAKDKLKILRESIIHYVPGGWDGQAQITAICGKRISYVDASSLFTNCPECKDKWKTSVNSNE